MERVKIDIVQLGESKHDDVYRYIKKIKRISRSRIFQINNIKKINLPRSDFWGYADETLKSIVKPSDSTDVTICFIDYPLVDNYFVRRFAGNLVVATFYETDEIFARGNIDLKNYVLITLLESATLFLISGENCEYHYSRHDDEYDRQFSGFNNNTKRNSRHINESSMKEATISPNFVDIHHDETRGCLFDMCGLKEEIIVQARNPKICYECEAKLRRILLPESFLFELKKELRQIKRHFYYRIGDCVKKHPILSLTIAAIATIILNLASSIIFRLFFS